MKGYLSIGAVSKLKKVSIKSLRYYDRIGVFRPAYVNESTNYRYYTQDQLYVLDAISLCVELGIPLHDFEKYVDDEGVFNLQGLLYDGKLLAEQKISDIRERLGAVQAALRALDNAPLMVNIVKKDKEPAPLTRESFTQKNLPERCVLTAPYSTDPDQKISQQILRLFMLAQLLGMTAAYPAGILYEYTKGTEEPERFLFIQVDNKDDCKDKRIRTLPAGDYHTITGSSQPVCEHSQVLDALEMAGQTVTIIETDILDSEDKELQIMA